MRILTGIQPSGQIHLGNYFGAIRNILDMQEKGHEVFIFIADFHALTTVRDPEALRQGTLSAALDFLACGVDPERTIFWRQSDVPEVQELAWLLSIVTPMGLLERCHSYKDKLAHGKEATHGLFAYPVLMAADILLYQPDYVPVGEDQKQHVEICRDIAQRFNSIYGDVFKIPEPMIAKTGARIYGLSTPGDKMSKSVPDGCVFLMDSPDDIRRKFKRAVTDSDRENCVRFDKENKPGVANLMNIYATLTGKTIPEIEAEFDGQGYGVFKPAVGEAVVEALRPIREEAERLMKDKAYLNDVYLKGAEKASYVANKTLRKVYKKVGFYQI